ncbi:hypothetical protein [Mediterraneibacter glycyrrhizinilyticus]|uniref:hypothetical protein n=1 Tax=Mediterraneibacter glycyrrhizinilyticus TaxID=342942 RepID=UPI0025A3B7D6|nr:hypothetical protein [Mediterraneibacter glycyrrhizinilyticus]MDM8125112.1 hypothetical protein [Mediterraneibacter glycyrrhizinilyticus]
MKAIRYVLVIMGCLFLTGCSGIKKVPEEEDILSDLEENYPSNTIDCCDNLEIIKSQLFEEDKEWTADIIINASDEYATMASEITVVYDYYDDQGWMMNLEQTMYPIFNSNDIHSGMNATDIEVLLYNWAGERIEKTDAQFDDENDRMYINYKRTMQESSFFDSTFTGQLECVYNNTDEGWVVANDYQDEKEYSLRIQDVLGQYEAGNNVIQIKDISSDGKKIVFSGYGEEGDVEIKIPYRKKETIIYQNQDYHAEFLEFEYSDANKTQVIKAIYQITDLDTERDNSTFAFRTSTKDDGTEYPTLSISGVEFWQPGVYEELYSDWDFL